MTSNPDEFDFNDYAARVSAGIRKEVEAAFENTVSGAPRLHHQNNANEAKLLASSLRRSSPFDQVKIQRRTTNLLNLEPSMRSQHLPQSAKQLMSDRTTGVAVKAEMTEAATHPSLPNQFNPPSTSTLNNPFMSRISPTSPAPKRRKLSSFGRHHRKSAMRQQAHPQSSVLLRGWDESGYNISASNMVSGASRNARNVRKIPPVASLRRPRFWNCHLNVVSGRRHWKAVCALVIFTWLIVVHLLFPYIWTGPPSSEHYYLDVVALERNLIQLDKVRSSAASISSNLAHFHTQMVSAVEACVTLPHDFRDLYTQKMARWFTAYKSISRSYEEFMMNLKLENDRALITSRDARIDLQKLDIAYRRNFFAILCFGDLGIWWQGDRSNLASHRGAVVHRLHKSLRKPRERMLEEPKGQSNGSDCFAGLAQQLVTDLLPPTQSAIILYEEWGDLREMAFQDIDKVTEQQALSCVDNKWYQPTLEHWFGQGDNNCENDETTLAVLHKLAQYLDEGGEGARRIKQMVNEPLHSIHLQLGYVRTSISELAESRNASGVM